MAVSLAIGAGEAACSTFSSPDSELPDAGADAPAGDAPNASGDGGADAAAWIPFSARDASPAHFCADFDKYDDITFGWTKTNLALDGAIGATDAALSPPRAFFAELPGADGGLGSASLIRTRPTGLDTTGMKKLALSFAMRMDLAPFDGSVPAGYVHLASLDFDAPPCVTDGSGNRRRAVEVGLNQGDIITLEVKGLGHACPADADAAASNNDYLYLQAALKQSVLRDGNFHTFELDMTTGGVCAGQEAGVGAVVLYVDGQPGDCGVVGIDPFAYASAHLDLTFGMTAGAGWNTTRVVHDNVTLDLE